MNLRRWLIWAVTMCALQTTYADVPPDASAPSVTAPQSQLIPYDATTGQNKLLDLEFTDVSVRTVLSFVSKYGKVNVIVADDVSGYFRKLALKNLTPDAAIQRITAVAGLQYHKSDDGTYIISRDLSSPAPLTDNSIFSPEPFAPARSTQPDISALQGAIGVPLHFVTTDLMGWWIDPVHHNAPAMVGSLPQNAVSPEMSQVTGSVFGPRLHLGDTTFTFKTPLPVGVQFAIDTPRNMVWVYGTQPGLEQCLKLIAQWDQPLRQVEIESLIVQIAPKDCASLMRFVPTGVSRGNWPRLGDYAVPDDWKSKLQKLVEQGRATIMLHSQRRVVSGEIVPLDLSAAGFSLTDQPAIEAATPYSGSLSSASDTSVTVLSQNSVLLTLKLRGVEDSAQLRNDETRVLWLGRGGSNMLLFLTPHIIPGVSLAREE